MYQRTLLLTPWYLPHKVLRWQDAVTMLFLEKADVVVEYDAVLRSPSMEMRAPAVIRARKASRRMKHGAKFCRVNVYTRDEFTCQYCGDRPSQRMLSYDHVVPRCAGGRTEWTNIVTACRPCNAKKGSFTCDEAGMWPRSKPKQPKALPVTGPFVEFEKAPDEWRDFLPALRI
jgi:5-methylcytosine-specific restriction endonuclease McrA